MLSREKNDSPLEAIAPMMPKARIKTPHRPETAR